jgi:hypothetical protein
VGVVVLCEPLVYKKFSMQKEKNATEDNEKDEHQWDGVQQSDFSIPLHELLYSSKKKMQSKQSSNGVTYALIGSSGCGKSFLLRKVFVDKLYGKDSYGARGDDKEYIVILPTESPDSDQLQNLPDDVSMAPCGLDNNLINWAFQMNQIHDKKYNFVFLFDDCIHLRFIPTVERLFLIMRNTNITSVVSLQYPRLIPKSIRTSVYFTFCMNLNNMEGVEVMVRDFLSRYIPGHNYKEMTKYYSDWTADHQCFLIDNLNHKVYQVNNRFYCREMPPLR